MGIIVRDKRKRPLFVNSSTPSKKVKVEVSVVPPATPTTPTVAPTRSYTPPPTTAANLDPRLKTTPSTLPKATVKDSPKEDDMGKCLILC